MLHQAPVPTGGWGLGSEPKARICLPGDVRVIGLGTPAPDRVGVIGRALDAGTGLQALRTGKCTTIKQADRIVRQQPSELKVGARASLVCWGGMPSGMWRQALFLRWASVLNRIPKDDLVHGLFTLILSPDRDGIVAGRHATTMSLRDALHDREAQAGTAPISVGLPVRVEDARKGVGGYRTTQHRTH